MSQPNIEGAQFKNLTASGQVTPAAGNDVTGHLLGFYVNSTNAGTLVLRSGATATNNGTAMSGTITPAAGTFHRFPATFQTPLWATIGGTALDVTFFWTV